MLDEAPLLPWLDHLKELLPPEGVVVVGAGAGTGPWVGWLTRQEICDVVLVEGDEAQFRHLEEAVGDREGWRITGQVVGGETGSVVFHHASHGAESGLIDPEALRSLWPNIKTRRREERQSICLADLVEQGAYATWVIVNCFPAQPILEGAGGVLERVDVIVARVVLGDGVPFGTGTREDLTRYLEPFSFRCVAVELERHPALGRALYVRDLQEVARKLRGEARRLKQRVEEARSAVEELGVESRTQISELEARLCRVRVELEADKVAAEQLVEEKEQELAKLTDDLVQAKEGAKRQSNLLEKQARDLTRLAEAEAAEERRVVEADGQLRELKAALVTAHAELEHTQQRTRELKAELARVMEERGKREEELQQHHAEREKELLTETAEALARFEKERVDWIREKEELIRAKNEGERIAGEQRAELGATRKRLSIVQAEITENLRSQNSLREELAKAETQIELIKELILEERQEASR